MGTSRESDEFRVTLFLHNLLTEDDHAWLRTLTTEALDADEVKVLIYVRATGAVDNTACLDFSGLDTLTASRVLRRLRDRGLLEKHGAGNRTYYTLRALAPMPPPPAKPALGHGQGAGKASMPAIEACNPDMEGLGAGIEGFSANLPLTRLLQRLPPQLATQITAQRGKRQFKKQAARPAAATLHPGVHDAT